MRSMFLGAAFLTIGATTASVGAATVIQGSDTLELFTDKVLANPACSGVSNIDYAGGGSSTGQNAMTAATPTQNIAPMSRYLNGTALACATAPEGEGIVVGLDGVVVMANNAEGTACGGAMATTGKAIGAYTFTSWKDVLSIVYFGRNNLGVSDCNSQLRKDLVDNWGNLFSGGCAGGTCTKLNHAWRRSDFSGTSDVFITLVTANAAGGGSLSLPTKAGAKVNAFCNSGLASQVGGVSDFQDNDPIRRDCAQDEQVCSMPLYTGAALTRNDKKLGLVQVVFVPELGTTAENYPTQACTFGQCRFLTTGATVLNCANGKPQLFGKCFGPVRTTGLPAGTFDASCINPPNFTCFGATPGQDGRAYNLAVRKTNGVYAKDKENRAVFGGYFRIHTTAQTISPTGVMTLGASLCREDDATRQIGCLPQVDKCSIGFAGREADSEVLRPDSNALAIDGIQPTQAAIEALVTGVGTPFPLARKLYFNSFKGFGSASLNSDEQALVQCMSNKTIVDSAINDGGFVVLPGASLRCQDNGCGVGTGCENNVAPVPTLE